MLIDCVEKQLENNYEVKMIVNNEIKGFLPVTLHYIDNHEIIYYEISSKQPIKRIFEHNEMNYNELTSLLFQLYKILMQAEEYLINTNHILINPDYIYMNMETQEIYVTFYPECKTDVKTQFQSLSEYILNRVNHADEKAVFLAYQIYRNTRNTNFILEEILNAALYCNEDERVVCETEQKEEQREKQKENSALYFYNKENNRTVDTEEITEKDMDSEDKTGNVKRDGENEKNHRAKKWKEAGVKKKKGHKREYKILVSTMAGIFVFIYLKIECLLPNTITYQQYLIIVGILGMTGMGCIVKICMEQAKAKLEEEKEQEWEEEITELEEASDKTEITVKDEYEEDFTQEEQDSIQIYDFLSSGRMSNSLVAEENSYMTEGYERENDYSGDTMLLGSTERQIDKALSGKIQGKNVTYSLNQLPVTIGKKEDCVDIVIAHSSISRMHARFFEKDGDIYLEDLNSTNGTFKNGLRLEANETVKVEPDDEISFSKFVFTYH